MVQEWKGEYRELMTALVHYNNIYAAAYKVEKLHYKDISYSYAQVQVIGDLLENQDRKDNMSTIANRLGISKSNFTKIIHRLISKGLVEKNKYNDNQKELILTATQLGRDLYEDYSKEILRWHFSPMFNVLKEVPPEYLKKFGEGLDASMKYAVCIDDKKIL